MWIQIIVFLQQRIVLEKTLHMKLFLNLIQKKQKKVIIMNPKNGEILAMATYPNYNLNEPFSIIPTGKTEEEWNTIEAFLSKLEREIHEEN